MFWADGWATIRRNGTNPIQANSTRFPRGIKAIADYVHAKGDSICRSTLRSLPVCQADATHFSLSDPGLKLGIYSDSGTQTCAKYTASLGYEIQDAQQFADWGVDLLKYDNCFSVPPSVVRSPLCPSRASSPPCSCAKLCGLMIAAMWRSPRTF